MFSKKSIIPRSNDQVVLPSFSNNCFSYSQVTLVSCPDKKVPYFFLTFGALFAM
jgi:hypothetical protein